MKFNCSYTELVDIHKLVPHPKNPNKHTDQQIDRLSKIIDFQGQRHPVIVSKTSGFIVAGHGRLQSMQKLGWEKVAVDYQEFENEAQEYAFLVADNAIAEWSALDLSKINMDFLELGPELDLDQLGIKDFVVEPIEKFEPQSDEDEVPELKEEPVTKRGDIWLLGNHRLMCGDSTMIDDVEKLMVGEKADMVHTDPPYNIAYEGGSKKREVIENDSLGDNFPQFLLSFYTNAFTVTKSGGAIYVWHAPTETHRFIDKFIEAGFLFKSYIIWNKNNSTFGRSDYHWKHEPAIYGWKEGAAHKWCGDRKQTTVWDMLRPSKSDEHPTMKPVELCERAILNSSDSGDTILDLFLGSGSTLIACEKNTRKCFGLELSDHYCDVIINRWQKYTGKQAILESTKQTYDELKAAKHG